MYVFTRPSLRQGLVEVGTHPAREWQEHSNKLGRSGEPSRWRPGEASKGETHPRCEFIELSDRFTREKLRNIWQSWLKKSGGSPNWSSGSLPLPHMVNLTFKGAPGPGSSGKASWQSCKLGGLEQQQQQRQQLLKTTWSFLQRKPHKSSSMADSRS